MGLDKDHVLLKDFRKALKQLYNITSNNDIMKWSVDQVKKYSFDEMAQILNKEELSHHLLYKLCAVEMALRKGMVYRWILGAGLDNRLLLDVYTSPTKYISYEFIV